MTYEESISYLNSLSKFGMKPGLDRIKKLLSSLGNPQNDLKFIHVAGTNGKGSTCAYISSILKCSGLKTGLFISPFIIEFRERMQINGEMIPKKIFIELMDYIIPFVKDMQNCGEYITEFELITVIAFMWFKKENCDVVVLEVGLGGRLDATNVISTPLVSVITSVSYDHVNVLGETIEKIAKEKAGILKPNGTLVLYPCQQREVISVVKNIAEELNNKIIIPNLDVVTNINANLNGTRFNYRNEKFYIRLLGKYQVNNAITAISVMEQLVDLGYKINIDNIKLGLYQTRFPARFEIMSREPLIIVDGTHNPGGAVSLAESIKLYLNGMRIVAIIGMLKDKDISNVINIVGPLVSEFILTRPDNQRAMDEYDLQKIVLNVNPCCTISQNVDNAVKLAFSKIDDNTAVLVFGSLYLCSQVRPLIKNYKYI